MQIAFLDETDHTAANKFTVCGLTSFPIEAVDQVSQSISDARAQSKAFKDTDYLKFASASRPENCSLEVHTGVKRKAIEIASKNDATFFAYAYFNPDKPVNRPERNRLYGFNTLLQGYDAFLRSRNETGVVLCDRLDLSKAKDTGFKDGFDFLRRKFQVGNEFPDGNSKKLSKIIAFAQTAEGLSHLSSVNDILTGGMRYVANGENEVARAKAD